MSAAHTRPHGSGRAPVPPRRVGAKADVGLAAFRLLLGAYPPAFRAAYGREMTQLFRDQRRAAAAAGSPPGLGFWAAVVWDVAQSAPALRADAVRTWWSAWWSARRNARRREPALEPVTGGPHTPPSLQPEEGTMTARRAVAGLAVFGGLYELANTGAEVWAGYEGPMGGWRLAVALAFLMGALLLAAGVAALRGGPGAARLSRGAALACLALVVGLQLTWPFMSIFSRLLGVGLPLALLLVRRRGPGPSAPAVAAGLVLACALPARAAAQAPAAQPPAAQAGASAAPAVRDLPLTDAERQAYVGTYRGTLPQGGTGLVRVYLRGDTLRMSPSDDSRAPRLLYQGGHVFHAEGVPDFVITFAVEKGRASGFSVQKEDGVIRATRVPAGTP